MTRHYYDDDYEPMAGIVPEGSEGVARIEHQEVSARDASFSQLRAAMGHRDEGVDAGVYCRLTVGRTLMMTDTGMEKRSNLDVLMKAKGDVLIAGLGIGMILLPLLKNPEVKTVTVVEKYADVVTLVEPHIRKAAGKNADKLVVVVDDILDWTPAKGQKWDTIYFDIWPSICTDNLKEMEKLHRKFARRKTPGAWMDSWMRSELKYRKRMEQRRGW